MKNRLDTLILERAPWLGAQTSHVRAVRKVLYRLLSYDRTLTLATALQHDTSERIMDVMGDMLARSASITGLHHIPAAGPALIVANHPTGIADGVILHHVVTQIRPDIYAFANKDILRLLPQMENFICPVEWRTDKRTHASARETMQYLHHAKDAGRIGLIFPSGRLAKRTGLTLNERPWMSSAAMLARKFDLPVIPINIKARNSALFYLFDLIHPTLRDITLFHETLNKSGQHFNVTIGAPIAGSSLPLNADEGIEVLRSATLALGAKKGVGRPRGPQAEGLLGHP